MKLELTKEVKEIINFFEYADFQIYLVGGCVRDLLLNREVNDYDFATDATPCEMIELLSDIGVVIPTGIKHGTVTFLYKNKNYEITTFRTDGNYTDSRHPDEVIFSKTIKEDLCRRDFTVNAIAYNPNEGLIDEFNGVTDLKNKVIRAVGTPEDRMKEDALRILRAFRFSGKLGFEIEGNTLKAMELNKNSLLNISAERIYKELTEILSYDIDVNKLFFLPVIIPELNDCFECMQNNRYHNKSVGEHIYLSVNNIRGYKLKLTMLLHDIAKPSVKQIYKDGTTHFKGHEPISAEKAGEILKRLKADKKTIDKVVFLIANHHYPLTLDNAYIKRDMFVMGEENYLDLIEVVKADNMAKNTDILKEQLEGLKVLKNMAKNIIEKKEPYKLSDLKINGNDIIKLGIKGKDVKYALMYALSKVWENKNNNDKDKLITFLKEKF